MPSQFEDQKIGLLQQFTVKENLLDEYRKIKRSYISKVKCTECGLTSRKNNLKRHFRSKHQTLQCMPSAVCVDKALGIYIVPKSKSGVLRPIHVQKCFRKPDHCKLFCENNFCMEFMEICGKSGLGYEMREHLNMVENLNALFPETIMLSENVLESLSNGSNVETRCLKPETIEKCKEINNLAIAKEKWPIVAFDNEDNVHMSVFTSKVHHNARLKCFAGTYYKTDKILDCGCCTRKIICVHKAMSIWFLEQTQVIS